jgi:excisionase family DNA binding protein
VSDLNQRQKTSGIRTHQEAEGWERQGGVRRGLVSVEAERSADTRRKLLTAEAVAERCDLPLSTLYEMVRQDRIGGVVRLGRLIRFHPDQFEAWLEAGGQALPGGWRQEEA